MVSAHYYYYCHFYCSLQQGNLLGQSVSSVAARLGHAVSIQALGLGQAKAITDSFHSGQKMESSSVCAGYKTTMQFPPIRRSHAVYAQGMRLGHAIVCTQVIRRSRTVSTRITKEFPGHKTIRRFPLRS